MFIFFDEIIGIIKNIKDSAAEHDKIKKNEVFIIF